MLRIHGRGQTAEVLRKRRWRVTNFGRNVMGHSPRLREQHFSHLYSGAVN